MDGDEVDASGEFIFGYFWLFLVIFGYFLVIFGYFLVIFGYFLVIFGYVRTGNWTDVDVVFCSQGPYEAEREIKRRAEIAEYWEEKARRGEGIGEESRGKLNERGNLETY